MKTDLRSLPWQCLTVAAVAPFVAQAASAAPHQAAPASVTCTVRDAWAGPLGSVRIAKPAGPSVGSQVPTSAGAVVEADPSDTAVWNPTYAGQGLRRVRSWARSRVLRRGVLWRVDPTEVGATQRRAGTALLRAGAAAVFYKRDGSVLFRATEERSGAVARRAAASLGFRGTPEASGNAAVASAAGQASVDVAMMRVEGAYSNGPVAFIDALPSGMSVYPFGTSFAVYVPAERVEEMWSAIDGEGGRVLMVGASAPASTGSQAAEAVRHCGGSALLARFPTPRVVSADRRGVVMETEGQRLVARPGDVVLVVQAPPYGRGIEMALLRVTGR